MGMFCHDESDEGNFQSYDEGLHSHQNDFDYFEEDKSNMAFRSHNDFDPLKDRYEHGICSLGNDD